MPQYIRDDSGAVYREGRREEEAQKMTSGAAWPLVLWVCYHALWLRTMKLTVVMSAQELIDVAIDGAISRMRAAIHTCAAVEWSLR